MYSWVFYRRFLENIGTYICKARISGFSKTYVANYVGGEDAGFVLLKEKDVFISLIFYVKQSPSCFGKQD